MTLQQGFVVGNTYTSKIDIYPVYDRSKFYKAGTEFIKLDNEPLKQDQYDRNQYFEVDGEQVILSTSGNNSPGKELTFISVFELFFTKEEFEKLMNKEIEYKGYLPLLDYLNKGNSDVHKFAYESLVNILFHESSTPIPGAMSKIEEKDDEFNNFDTVVEVLREMEKYNGLVTTLDELMDYYSDKETARKIVEEEEPKIRELFKTGKERYFVQYVEFDHMNNQIYDDYIYSYEAALTKLRHMINCLEEDSVCMKFIRNDKDKYYFQMENTDYEDYESDEDYEDDENEFEDED